MKTIFSVVVVAIIALTLGGGFGYLTTPTLSGIINGVLAVAVLSLMETAESMDNALVDVKILRKMEPKWQRRYLTLGMPVAVIGMRFLFPVLVVSAIAEITPWSSVTMAFKNPHLYATIMQTAQNKISAFGGAFLLLIALDFFFDDEKDSHWIAPFEKLAAKLSEIDGIIYGLTSLAVLVFSFFVPNRIEFITYGIIGMVSYVLIKNALSWAVGDNSANTVLRGGFLSFLYLEFIDASFSFDSVISAFAITTDPVIVAIGLGVGAYVVRLITLAMLKHNTSSELAYVEHAAFYTILILSVLMFVSVVTPVPEWITGTIGLVLIGGGFIASLIKNKREKALEASGQNSTETD